MGDVKVLNIVSIVGMLGICNALIHFPIPVWSDAKSFFWWVGGGLFEIINGFSLEDFA